MPIVINYSPVAALAGLALNSGISQGARQRQMQDSEMQARQQQMTMEQQQAAQRNQQWLSEQQARQEDEAMKSKQFTANQAMDQQRLGLDQQRLGQQMTIAQMSQQGQNDRLFQTQDAITGRQTQRDASTQATYEDALNNLDQQHDAGLIDDVSWARARTNLAAGSKSPMGALGSTGTGGSGDVYRFNAEFRTVQQGNADQRNKLDKNLVYAQKAFDSLNKAAETTIPGSTERQQAQQAFQILQQAKQARDAFKETPLPTPPWLNQSAPAPATQPSVQPAAAPTPSAVNAAPGINVRSVVQQVAAEMGFTPGQMTPEQQQQLEAEVRRRLGQ